MQVTPPTTGAPTTGACSATYRTINSWPGGFQGEVTVKADSSAINGWTVRWTLDSGQSISQAWNGRLTTSGTTASVAIESYSGVLATAAWIAYAST